MTIILNGQIYSILSFQHVKPGKGGAFVRTKLKDLKSDNLIDKTFRAGEKVEQAFLETKKMQFLYRQGESFHFMDQQSFEESEMSQERLGDKVKFLKEDMVLSVTVCDGAIMDINLPTFVELRVEQTEPGVRADTVKSPAKAAILETGAKIDVPLFVNQGDLIKIDTRTEKYVSRV